MPRVGSTPTEYGTQSHIPEAGLGNSNYFIACTFGNFSVVSAPSRPLRHSSSALAGSAFPSLPFDTDWPKSSSTLCL